MRAPPFSAPPDRRIQQGIALAVGVADHQTNQLAERARQCDGGRIVCAPFALAEQIGLTARTPRNRVRRHPARGKPADSGPEAIEVRAPRAARRRSNRLPCTGASARAGRRSAGRDPRRSIVGGDEERQQPLHAARQPADVGEAQPVALPPRAMILSTERTPSPGTRSSISRSAVFTSSGSARDSAAPRRPWDRCQSEHAVPAGARDLRRRRSRRSAAASPPGRGGSRLQRRRPSSAAPRWAKESTEGGVVDAAQRVILVDTALVFSSAASVVASAPTMTCVLSPPARTCAGLPWPRRCAPSSGHRAGDRGAFFSGAKRASCRPMAARC